MSAHPPVPGPSQPPPQVGFSARLRASAAHSARALGLVWRSAPGGVVALGLFTIAAAALPPFVAYVGKLIIDAVLAAHAAAPGIARAAALTRAVRLVGVELGAVVAIAGFERALALVRQLVGLRLGIDLNVRILEKARHLELRHFEDPEFYDKLTRARREASTRPLSLIQSNFQVVRHGLTLAGYIALLVGFSGWMALAVLVATVPAFIAEARFSGVAFRMRNWRSPDSRRLTYLEYVLANDEHAKEVKLFGLGPLLLDRYRRLAESFFADDRRLAVRRAGWGYALSLVSTAVFYGSYALIVVATVRGRLSLGDMTLYLVAFRQGQQSFQAVLSALGGMYEDTLYMSNLFEYFAIPTTAEAPNTPSSFPSAPKVIGPAVLRTEQGIRFEAVGFRYPGAERPVGQGGASRPPRRPHRKTVIGRPLGVAGHQRLRTPGAESGAWSARTAPGRPPSSSCSRISTSPRRDASSSTGGICATGTRRSCVAGSASSSRTSTNISCACVKTSPSAASNIWRTSCASGAPWSKAAHASWWPVLRRVSTRSSAAGSPRASSCRVASGRRSLWPARSCATKRTF